MASGPNLRHIFRISSREYGIPAVARILLTVFLAMWIVSLPEGLPRCFTFGLNHLETCKRKTCIVGNKCKGNFKHLLDVLKYQQKTVTLLAYFILSYNIVAKIMVNVEPLS